VKRNPIARAARTMPPQDIIPSEVDGTGVPDRSYIGGEEERGEQRVIGHRLRDGRRHVCALAPVHPR
jgi:hypothetical protein